MTTLPAAPTKKERPAPEVKGPDSWHTLEQAAVESSLATTPHGLSRAEAAQRLDRYGPNVLEEIEPPRSLAILIHQFKSPLIYLLVLAAGVTLALGEYVDTAVIGAVLVLNAIIGFTQERRAEVSVRALMRLVSPRAHVVREGREWEIESQDLVPGDVVLLESGVRVPADLRLTSTTALAVDESLLTGESLPVNKRAVTLPEKVTLAERANMAYTGTIATSGRGRGIVVATGGKTELGAIAAEMREEERTATPLQQRMTRFAQLVTLVVAITAVAGFFLGLFLGHPAPDMFMLAVALAVAAIPEGLPVVLTIVLAVGVRRMARRRSIIRRLPAVETLGSTTVIGSDKTGTLTENRMTVEELWAGGQFFEIRGKAESLEPSPDNPDPSAHPALELALHAGALANEAEIYLTDDGLEHRGDPTEAALLVAAARLGIDHEQVRAAHEVFAEIPFESERQYSASIRIRDGRYHVFVKGAPERVLEMCTTRMGADELRPEDVLGAAREMASRGLRVLALAHADLPHPPHGPDEIKEPERLQLVGLVGMMDPPREGVREAIEGCQRSGIRVVMITGDHAVTAQAIGQKLGLASPGDPVLTGTDLAEMDDERLREEVVRVSVFARVSPDQKLRVVTALQSHGEAVAVTGDGVNDAPALKAADIGIAMGKSGTDVAREASDMVLADDNFVSIYHAVEEGRVTFDNLRKATFFLVSTGAATVLTLLVAMLMNWPLPFVPAQLLWLNLVTKGLQDVAMAFEPGERDVLRRPPRRRQEGIVSALLWERTVVTGLVMAAGTLLLFRWQLDATGSITQAQTVAVTAMVVFQTFHLGNSRSEYFSVFAKSPFSNLFLFVAAAAALLIHTATLYLPPTQFVLRVEPIVDLQSWMRIVVVSASIILAMELHKLLRRGPRQVREVFGARGTSS
jgi:magnesium-transporting ATPase (P-type)